MDPDFILCWRDADDGNNTRVYYNITSDQWNCAEHYGTCESCPRLQGDPDIAGVGVITAFMVSVSVTALLAIVFPILSPALPRPSTTHRSDNDVWLENILSRPIIRRLGKRRAKRWAMICYNLVFNLGDQQLTTAIALLVATLKKVHIDQTLSIYHLKLVTNLVRVGASAFAYVVICWRIKHDAKPDPHKGPPRLDLSMGLRIFLMLTLAVLLLYTGQIAAKADGVDLNCPASCAQRLPFDGGAAKDWRVKHSSLFATTDIQDEKSMGFGQIVALFLLLQPIIQVIDSISGMLPS
ncbi:hypothetical protein B0T20DRAFT_442588 [Sordaria brevicollis]|uniref:Uncharacterized protein n=1 Tax=Sordaria brevicollis TaxID=83679 RepID=A0AAE0UA84_SORBR|nr:hypothetical protein B0T20DRAFT_442588 [Sordaria brevicollis]